MSLVTTDVLFELTLASGAPASGARVVSILTTFEKDGAVVVPSRLEGFADSAGRLTQSMWPNTRGVNGSQYQVSVTLDGAPLLSATITVPEVDEADQPVPLLALLGTTPLPPVDAVTQALQQLQAAQGAIGTAVVNAQQAAQDAEDAADSVVTSSVRFDQAQALTGPQQQQARDNIGLGALPTVNGYTHNQGVASAVWTINHPLGKRPAVFVEDSSGDDVEGDVSHPSTSQVVITFSAPFSGVAYLS